MDSRKTYYLTKQQRAPMWLLSGICFLFSIWMAVTALTISRSLAPLLFPGSIVTLILGLPLFISATFTHISVSPEGIEYYWTFWGAKTAWKNVIGVTDQGLILDSSVRKENIFWRMLFTIQGRYPFIPLESFVSQWQRSELNQDIQKYTAHLVGIQGQNE